MNKLLRTDNYLSLTGNKLKLIAVIAMTADHAGLLLFDNNIILRILGRLAFPIFAYTTSEGYTYTRNRLRYFLTIFLYGCVLQICYSLFTTDLYMNIFITLSLSLISIFTVNKFRNNPTRINAMILLIVICFIFTVTDILPHVFIGFTVDYGFFGVLLPVFGYIGNSKNDKLLLFSFGLLCLNIYLGQIQWFSLLSLPLIVLYNGKRGTRHLKWFFYAYYPLHLLLIYYIHSFIN